MNNWQNDAAGRGLIKKIRVVQQPKRIGIMTRVLGWLSRLGWRS